MPLPSNFQCGNVKSIVMLKPNAVFLMEYNQNHFMRLGGGVSDPDIKFIIKREFRRDRTSAGQKAHRENLDLMYKLTRKVAGGGKGRTLDFLETNSFYLLKNSLVADTAIRQAITLMETNKDQITLVMMEFLESLEDLQAVFDSQDVDRGMLAVHAILDNANLHQLGKILAVDMFIGNSDRFDVSPADHRVINPGNIAMKQGVLIGFDPFDPNSCWAKLDQDLLSIKAALEEEGDKETWAGLLLLKQADMLRVAKDALNDLLTLILNKFPPQEVTSRVDPKHLVTKKHYQRVVKGMQAGMADIKLICQARLTDKAGRQKAPTGLRSRMTALKWIKG